MSIHLSPWDPVSTLLGDHMPLTPIMLDTMWNVIVSEKKATEWMNEPSRQNWPPVTLDRLSNAWKTALVSQSNVPISSLSIMWQLLDPHLPRCMCPSSPSPLPWSWYPELHTTTPERSDLEALPFNTFNILSLLMYPKFILIFIFLSSQDVGYCFTLNFRSIIDHQSVWDEPLLGLLHPILS